MVNKFTFESLKEDLYLLDVCRTSQSGRDLWRLLRLWMAQRRWEWGTGVEVRRAGDCHLVLYVF